MNRREFLAAMAAGAVMTAEGLWMPGQKLISIQQYTVDFIGPGNQVLSVRIGPNYYITVSDLYRRLEMLRYEGYIRTAPILSITPELYELQNDWRISEYNHLTGKGEFVRESKVLEANT